MLERWEKARQIALQLFTGGNRENGEIEGRVSGNEYGGKTDGPFPLDTRLSSLHTSALLSPFPPVNNPKFKTETSSLSAAARTKSKPAQVLVNA